MKEVLDLDSGSFSVYVVIIVFKGCIKEGFFYVALPLTVSLQPHGPGKSSLNREVHSLITGWSD